MKIEHISRTKLKITLTKEEMTELDLDIYDFKHDLKSAGDAFWDVIEQSGEETDFFDDMDGIVVEVYFTNDGSCVLTATKTDGVIRGKKQKTPAHPVIYSFSDISEAAEGCKRISVFFNGTSNLYKYEGKYYLAAYGVNPGISLNSDVILSDYGETGYHDDIFEGVLAENGEILIKEDAVEVLCSYF